MADTLWSLMGKKMKELTFLRIRSLIADKEMVTAQANHDLAIGGEWQMDYAGWHKTLDEEIQRLLGDAAKEILYVGTGRSQND